MVNVVAGTPLSHKEMRSQRRAKRRKLLAQVNRGMHKMTKSMAQKRALSMVEGQSLTFTAAGRVLHQRKKVCSRSCSSAASNW